MVNEASFPPPGLPGLDPAWSRLITAPDADGLARTWHVLDTAAAGAGGATGGTTTAGAGGAAGATTTAGAGGATGGGDGAASASPAGTILCVHGNPTWSYAFRAVLADPPPGWRVVAADHLDMGYSQRTGTHRPLARRIDDLTRLTAELGLDDGPVVLLAHDWGGPIALGWGLAHRERLAGMVLTNTAVHQPADASAPRLIRAARLPGVLDNVTVRSSTFVRGATGLSRRGLDPAVRAAYAAPYDTPERRAAVGGFVRDIPLDPGHPSAATLDAVAAGLAELSTVPTLLLWGPQDPVFSDRYLHDLEARLPHADVHRVEGASHLTPEDADLAGALRRWVPAQVDIAGGGGVGTDVAAGDGARGSAGGRAGTDPGSGPAGPEVAAPSGADPARVPSWAALTDPARATTDAIVEPPGPGDPSGAPRRISFGELSADVHALAAGLYAHGVQPGDRVASLVTPGRELATLLYACWRLGAVVVVADAGLGPKGLGRALRSAAPDHLVAIPKALAAATALRWPGRRVAAGDPPAALLRSSGTEVTLTQLIERGHALIGRGPGTLAHGHEPVTGVHDPLTAGDPDAALPPPPGPDAEAAIAFTSGSTGPAKGVVYRHRQLEAQRDALRRTYDITDNDRLVAAFAPFALYGPALGITSMVPDMDVTAPATLTATKLAEAVVAVEATLVFASPAALTNVARTAGALRGDHIAALAGVRTLLSAGAPVPARLLRRLGAVVPNASAHTPYGMTECLPVADIDLDTIEAVGNGNGVCVGHPVPGVEVEVSPLDVRGAATGPRTRTPWTTGEVCVAASHRKDRYDRLALTELESSREPGWHRTGDVGHLDAQGRIWIEGRLSHIITTAAGVVTPVGVEQAVESIAHVTMAAAVGVGPAGTQQVVVVVATDPAPGRMQLAPLTLVDRVRSVVDVEVAAVLAVPELPVDIRHQSKIDRAEVARRAAGMLAGRGVRHAGHGDGSEGGHDRGNDGGNDRGNDGGAGASADRDEPTRSEAGAGASHDEPTRSEAGPGELPTEPGELPTEPDEPGEVAP